jgi:hypothetical protein
MRRIPLVLTAAMVMALVTVAMALPALAAPPQEGDFAGGSGLHCTSDPTTSTETCVGGGGGHAVGTEFSGGAGQHREDTFGPTDTTSFSGGSGGHANSPEGEPGGEGGHCEPSGECVGGSSWQ